MIKRVVRQWVWMLQLKEQSVLLLAMRGCDVAAKDDPGKRITGALRAILLHNAHRNPGSFMYSGSLAELHFPGTDAYPMHWYMHVVHAIEIVGYRHPDPEIRREFNRLYMEACTSLHMTPETLAQMDQRLQGDWDNPCDSEAEADVS